jgi:hypothetical protein
MLSLTLEYHIYPVALRYWIELWRTTMNAMNLAITFLLVLYFLAVAERLTQPEIIGDDGESMGYDNYAEMQWENTRDYYLAADNGYEGDW